MHRGAECGSQECLNSGNGRVRCRWQGLNRCPWSRGWGCQSGEGPIADPLYLADKSFVCDRWVCLACLYVTNRSTAANGFSGIDLSGMVGVVEARRTMLGSRQRTGVSALSGCKCSSCLTLGVFLSSQAIVHRSGSEPRRPQTHQTLQCG